MDNSYGVFIPTLKEKPNQIEPLHPLIIKAQNEPKAHLTWGDHKTQKGLQELPHPYQPELLEHLESIRNTEVLAKEPTKYGTMDDTPFMFINKQE